MNNGDVLHSEVHRHFLMFTKTSQKISTQRLTVLIISVILHLEQRKGIKIKRKRVPKTEFGKYKNYFNGKHVDR